MFLAVIAVFAMGITTGISMDQNVPAVQKFGDKYLSADAPKVDVKESK